MLPLPTENLRNPAALARIFLTCLIGVLLDLWTKVLAFDKLADGGYALIPGWLHFQITRNRGAVFGWAQGARYVFIAISIAAIFFILYLFLVSGRQWFYQIVLGMLMAGVIGNLYDRIEFGYVRDMIYIFPGRTIAGRELFPWIFNVADTLLCTGVFFLIIYSYVRTARESAAAPQPRPRS